MRRFYSKVEKVHSGLKVDGTQGNYCQCGPKSDFGIVFVFVRRRGDNLIKLPYLDLLASRGRH